MSNAAHTIEEQSVGGGTHRTDALGNDALPPIAGPAANENAPTSPATVLHPTRSRSDRPQLELRHVGDGRAFIRALARIIVRGELISAGLIAAPEPCADNTRAG